MSDGVDPTHTGRGFTPTLQPGGDAPASRLARAMEHLRGWPAAVPVRNDLRRRIRFELTRTSVGEDLVRRLRHAGMSRIGMAAAWGGVMGLAPSLTQVTLQLTGWTPAVIPLALIGLVAVEILAFRQLARRIAGPRTRAALRREGIDCCVRCGHLMGTGEPAASCPECGMDHQHLPLGWGPGPLRPLEQILRDSERDRDRSRAAD